MPQFLAHYIRFANGGVPTAPAGLTWVQPEDPGSPGKWAAIGKYSEPYDAYAVADSVAATYFAAMYDRENGSIYANSPDLAALRRPIYDAALAFRRARMTADDYLGWERNRILDDARGQGVFSVDAHGLPLNSQGRRVTAGYFLPDGTLADGLAIMRAAVIVQRSSGQTGSSVTDYLAGLYGDSDQTAKSWTPPA